MLDKTFKLILILFVITTIAIPAAFTNPNGPAGSIHDPVPVPTPTSEKPSYTGYKGVMIGTTTDEARAKLGNPKDKSNEQDSFVFSDNESVQLYYDASKTVTAITVTFSGKIEAAPTAKAVFGEDAEIKPDGGIFKMVRYPKAGFWISYNKIAGSDPMVMIAVQKM